MWSNFRNAEEAMTLRRRHPTVHSNRLRETMGAQRSQRTYKVEDDETIEHFLESLRQRGLFAGLEVGCDEYERRTNMALRKFEDRFASRLRAAAASAHAAASSTGAVDQTAQPGAAEDEDGHEAAPSGNKEHHTSSEGAGPSADATRDEELPAPSSPCETAPPSSAEPDTVNSRSAEKTEHHAARDACATPGDDDAQSTDDESADLAPHERSRVMETATQQLLAHNYQGAISSFDRAMAMNPQGQELANMLIMRASCYLHLQRFDEALEDGKQATKLDVTTAIAARAFIRIGMAYEGLGRFTDAVRFGYDIAELLDVQNAHILRNKAAAEAHRDVAASEDSD